MSGPAHRHLDPEIAKLQAVLDRLGASSGQPRVLEAGCGSLSHVDLGSAHVVGVDISAEQLSRHDRIAEAIVADLETWDAPADQFDVIVCWDVLEHLRRPEKALANLVRATKAGGLMVLALPNLVSIKGIITKLTPYRFHVWAYRRLWGVSRAGTESRGPFPTYLRPATTPRALHRFAREAGLTVEYFSAYESLMQRRLRKNHPLLNAILSAGGLIGRIVSLGRIDPLNSDFILVLRKGTPRPSGG